MWPRATGRSAFSLKAGNRENEVEGDLAGEVIEGTAKQNLWLPP